MSKNRSTAESEDHFTRLQKIQCCDPLIDSEISWAISTIKSQAQEIKRLREQLRIANEFNSHHKEPQGND